MGARAKDEAAAAAWRSVMSLVGWGSGRPPRIPAVAQQFGLSPKQVSLEVVRARDSGWRDPGTPFEVILATEGLDPLASPVQAVETLSTLAEAGATVVNVRFRHGSASECADQIAAMAELSTQVHPASSRW